MQLQKYEINPLSNYNKVDFKSILTLYEYI